MKFLYQVYDDMVTCIYVSSLAYMQVANMLAVKTFLQKSTHNEPRPNMLAYFLKIVRIYTLWGHPIANQANNENNEVRLGVQAVQPGKARWE